MADTILHNHDDDGVDRRGFLKCMAWAGTGALWAMQGGVLRSIPLGRDPRAAAGFGGDLFFAQISDSHIGFSKEANPDIGQPYGVPDHVEMAVGDGVERPGIEGNSRH